MFTIGICVSLLIANFLNVFNYEMFKLAASQDFDDAWPLVLAFLQLEQLLCYFMAYWVFSNRYLEIAFKFEDLVAPEDDQKEQEIRSKRWKKALQILFWSGATLLTLGVFGDCICSIFQFKIYNCLALGQS